MNFDGSNISLTAIGTGGATLAGGNGHNLGVGGTVTISGGPTNAGSGGSVNISGGSSFFADAVPAGSISLVAGSAANFGD